MRISDWSSDVCSSDLKIYFGMLTLAFGMVFYTFLLKFYRLTGGDEGMRVLRPFLLGQDLGEMSKTAYLVGPYYSYSAARSDARRVGKDGVSTCRSRWSP